MIRALLLVFIITGCSMQAVQSDKEIIESLLHEFLKGASVNDMEVHKRFWADDLIYTGSAGNRTTKTEILESLDDNATNAPSFIYSAEEIVINLYGTTAVLAFRLVAKNEDGERTEFYNTGTLLNRNNTWQVVSWQATRIPPKTDS